MTTGRMLGRRGGMRAAIAVAAVFVAGAVAPAGAGAFQVTIKDDLGNPTPLPQGNGPGPTVRWLSQELGFAFAPDEARLNISADVTVVEGPNRVNVLSPPLNCRAGTERLLPRPIVYRGNTTYTVTVRLYAEKDYSCTGKPVKQGTFTYTVNAFTALGPPPGTLLTRKPGDPTNLEYKIPVQINPGASWAFHEVHYALNGQISADGGPASPGQIIYPDEGTQQARVRFRQPGRYLFVARVKAPGTTPDVFTPWSQPVSVQVKAPFDFKSRFLTWTDNRGPSYRVRVRVVERAARGRVTFRLARGKKRGRYRRIGTARISRRGAITKRFRVRRTGNYRLRISYKGNDLVARGNVTFRVRFKRRIIFRSSASSVG